MGSSSKKRQTMAKMLRERMVKERRARKQERKDEKKQAAADAKAAEMTLSGHAVDNEVDSESGPRRWPSSLIGGGDYPSRRGAVRTASRGS